MNVHKTRYAELGYVNNFGDWRFVDRENPRADGLPSCIGPHYPTKAELLANLEQYAAEYGCDGASYKPLDRVCKAVLDALADRLEDFQPNRPGTDGPILWDEDNYPNKTTGQLRGMIEQASYTLFYGGFAKSPEWASTVFEGVILDFVLRTLSHPEAPAPSESTFKSALDKHRP